MHTTYAMLSPALTSGEGLLGQHGASDVASMLLVIGTAQASKLGYEEDMELVSCGHKTLFTETHGR